MQSIQLNRLSLRSTALTIALTALLLGASAGCTAAGEEYRAIAAYSGKVTEPATATEAVAVFAGGCFWGVQGVFQHVRGVTNAVSGYAGGDSATAKYEDVGTGSTGHAEAVRVTYDPHKVSYAQLLHIYFSVAHDPTQLNRQGPDSGTQYRSAIFSLDAAQARVAGDYIAQLNQSHVFGAPIATRIEPGRQFFPAEAYHQDFLTQHPTHPYIVINDLPKVAALKKLFPADFRADPALVATAHR
ncbi:peptide-methionine (S)-S-oxide reductase [Actimicrobium sp. GrIS 1.19]|uniref:peptide-methionine (S)-S-oxide reductase MsrA n=1 Tax=Actimicrobium sp. GrIS 1.19 TaxID=3071708 RepID=UPI002E058225|nr:peptide-methionine (S)-S-oxide reductase [Actimicrobium sp. GrIS 1.19]